MRTVGVDLSAEAANTAVAIVDWGEGQARVRELRVGASDEVILRALAEADRAALDAPFGWPEPFADFLAAHREGHVAAPSGLTGIEWRRTLSRRATDRFVAEKTGVTPLSVSADRIAAVAMRAAGLLGALHAAGELVDRAGGGRLVEVYPAAGLKVWDLPYKSYKGAHNNAALNEIVDALATQMPGLALGEAERLCRRSDDALDAVICALLARAAALGVVHPVPEGLRKTASHEGWIVIPAVPLTGLLRE